MPLPFLKRPIKGRFTKGETPLPEFTQVDYQNLAAIVSLAKCEGIQQAAQLLVLHDKLLKAAGLTVEPEFPLIEE